MPLRHRSGRHLHGHPDRVFELVHRHAVFIGHDLKRLARLEHGQCILKPGTTSGEDRLPEPSGWIRDQLRDLVGGQLDQPGVTVRAERDSSKVERDDLVENSLAIADDDELLGCERRAGVLTMFRVVE